MHWLAHFTQAASTSLQQLAMRRLTGLTAIGIEALSLEVTSPANITEIKNHIDERTWGSLD